MELRVQCVTIILNNTSSKELFKRSYLLNLPRLPQHQTVPPKRCPPSPALPSNTASPKYDYGIKLQCLELYGKNKKDSPKIIIRDAGGDAESLVSTEAVVESAHNAMVCLAVERHRRMRPP